MNSLTILHPGEALRVAFFAQLPLAWPNWESIVRAAMAHPGIEPHVVLVPPHSPRTSIDETDALRTNFVDNGIPYTHLRAYDLERRRPHVAFLPTPYDQDRPDLITVEGLRAAGVRLAYVSYALDTGGGVQNLRYQYNEPLLQLAWRIYARSERQRAMYGRYGSNGNGRVMVTGHPKLDQIASLAERSADPEIQARARGRKTVLWCPHFHVVDPPQWSTFDLFVEAMLEEMQRRPELFMILRPHPIFFRARRNHPAFGMEWDRRLRERLSACENIVLDERGDHLAAFAASGALMADPGSFLLEFLPTGGPILHLKHPQGLGLNEDGGFIASCEEASTAAEITSFLDRFEAGDDPGREARLGLVQEYLHAVDGRCGERICEDMLNTLRGGDETTPELSKLDTRYTDGIRLRVQRKASSLAPVEDDASTVRAIAAILDSRREWSAALDTNCGDGRFVRPLLSRFPEIDAFDVSTTLVESSQRAMAAGGHDNVRFDVSTFEDIETTRRYDLALCIDTFVHVTDDEALMRGLDRLRAMTLPGATVIVRQATASAAAVIAQGEASFRLMAPTDLPRMFARRSFGLISETIVREFSQRTDRLYVFARIEVCHVNESGSTSHDRHEQTVKISPALVADLAPL